MRRKKEHPVRLEFCMENAHVINKEKGKLITNRYNYIGALQSIPWIKGTEEIMNSIHRNFSSVK